MSLQQKSDSEILAIANAIMDNLMDASTQIDHARHVRDFTDRTKSIVTEEHLKKVCAKYQHEKGFFSERTFVALFRRPDGVGIVWRQRFTKQPGDYVAEMLLVEQNGRYLVDHVLVW